MATATPATIPSHFLLNNELNIVKADGTVDFDKDRQAMEAYLQEEVGPNLIRFNNLFDQLNYMVEEGYYEEDFLYNHEDQTIQDVFDLVYGKNFQFRSFMGAFKFYNQYALKTFTGDYWLEAYEDRVAINALYLSNGDRANALAMAEELIEQRYQPATPTFMNVGKAKRGEMTSCFLIEVSDNMNSIGRSINSALQLSKLGGGVSFNLSNIRAHNDPIKETSGLASGVMPIMKLYENSFSYADQLG